MSGVLRWFKSPDGKDVPASTADPLPVSASLAAGSTTIVTQATAANLNAQVVGAGAAGATAVGNPVGMGGIYQAAPLTIADGQRGNIQLSTVGRILVAGGVASAGVDGQANTLAFGAGAQDGQAVTRLNAQANHNFNGATWDREVKPNATSRLPSSANTTNATLVKNAAGNVTNINGYNSSATITYLKLYRKATAPTVGTDTPFVTLALPALSVFDFIFDSLYFTTGIGYGLTTDAADAGTTAVAAGAILGLTIAYA